jgi:hypothetical protein
MTGAIDCATKSSPAGVITTISTFAMLAGSCLRRRQRRIGLDAAGDRRPRSPEADVVVRHVRSTREQQMPCELAVDEDLDAAASRPSTPQSHGAHEAWTTATPSPSAGTLNA